MALIKKGFKKFEKEDIRTEYKACDTTHKAPDDDHPDLVNGPLKFLEGCLPSGTLITFKSSAIYLDSDGDRQVASEGAAFTVPAYTALPAIAGENVDNSSVFLLAEDFYSSDDGFVYYIVENLNNLEDRV